MKIIICLLLCGIYATCRLENINQQCSGCLYGIFYSEGTLLLMGFNVESTIGQLNYEQIQHKFPAELDLCGLVKFGDCTDAEAHLNEIFKDVDITDNPILLHCELGTLTRLQASIFMHGKLQAIPYEVMEADQLYKDFCFTRLKCSLSLFCEPELQAINDEMHVLRKQLSDGSLAFQIEPTKIFVTNNGTQGSYINCDSLILDVLRCVTEAIVLSESHKENATSNRNKKRTTVGDFALNTVYGTLGCDYDVLNVNVLSCKSRENSCNEIPERSNHSFPAMNMCVIPKHNKYFIPLEVEAMAMLCKNTKATRLYDILIESICRALRLIKQSMIESLEENDSAKLNIPQIFHFFPQEFGHFLSCAYLDTINDNNPNMLERRKRLHRHFALPTTLPYFCRTNRCIFRNEIPLDSPLLNVHYGLRGSGVLGGKQSIVKGNYYYYHYLQQQIQDKGWGCAYRSLQTICSWFLLQGYTDQIVPTHHEIQKYLFTIGDKPSNFVGSSQWIGSTEVSMCLQGFLKVDSKILHAASGTDIRILAADIVMHFQTQGTPIMIGGGVLAHTIIGIDHCAQSGDMKFLILDPHYTGGDDLQIIQSKGWCGWKNIDFWDKKSYYNLCMPIKPIIF